MNDEQRERLDEIEEEIHELAAEIGADLPDRENVKTYEMTRPVHGEARLHSETVQYEAPESETYTEEVTIPAPMQDPDEAETKTVERKHSGPSPEEIFEYSSNSYLNEDVGEDTDIPAPGEVSRERRDE